MSVAPVCTGLHKGQLQTCINTDVAVTQISTQIFWALWMLLFQFRTYLVLRCLTPELAWLLVCIDVLLWHFLNAFSEFWSNLLIVLLAVTELVWAVLGFVSLKETKPEAVSQVCTGFSSVQAGNIRPNHLFVLLCEVFQYDRMCAIGGLLKYKALVKSWMFFVPGKGTDGSVHP